MGPVILAIVVIVALLLVCRCMRSKMYEGARGGRGITWVKYPGWFSQGGNIIQYPHFKDNRRWLARKCVQTQGCKGFSTDGWLKNKISPKRYWTRVPNKEALYIRKW